MIAKIRLFARHNVEWKSTLCSGCAEPAEVVLLSCVALTRPALIALAETPPSCRLTPLQLTHTDLRCLLSVCTCVLGCGEWGAGGRGRRAWASTGQCSGRPRTSHHFPGL